MTPENLLSRFDLFESFSGVRFTLALIHFLWLGGLFALAVAALSRLLRKASANSRYLLHLAALIALAAGLPLLYLATPPGPVRASAVGQSLRDATPPAEVSAPPASRTPLVGRGPFPQTEINRQPRFRFNLCCPITHRQQPAVSGTSQANLSRSWSRPPRMSPSPTSWVSG